MPMNTNCETRTIQMTVTAGNTGNPVFINSIPATITAIPSGGGTCTVQFSTSPYTTVQGGGGTWTNWPSGAVSATTTDYLSAPVTAVRMSAATGNGTLEVVQ